MASFKLKLVPCTHAVLLKIEILYFSSELWSVMKKGVNFNITGSRK